MWRLTVAAVEGVGACWLVLPTLPQSAHKDSQQWQGIGSRVLQWKLQKRGGVLAVEVQRRRTQMLAGQREQRGREDVVDMAGTETPAEQLLAVPSNTKQEGQTLHQCVVPHFD